jgi:hypothetical protein
MMPGSDLCRDLKKVVNSLLGVQMFAFKTIAQNSGFICLVLLLVRVQRITSTVIDGGIGRGVLSRLARALLSAKLLTLRVIHVEKDLCCGDSENIHTSKADEKPVVASNGVIIPAAQEDTDQVVNQGQASVLNGGLWRLQLR